ncbi:YesL family protein [Pseudalkalibacillus sp. R45]|uniref:YesL family protein n=1 Tax=Pseudalkalibacillus sp. R45 TaxID=3457433 RepID=UPI003FCCCEDA
MNIFSYDNVVYRILDKCYRFLLLNFLWLLTCLPVLTIFPGTAAMFAVIREQTEESEISIIRSFWYHFKENFKQSFGLGIIWTCIGFLLYLNMTLVFRMPDELRVIMTAFTFLFIFLYIITSLYLFPVLVNYREKTLGVIRNSFLFAIGQFLITIGCLLLLLLAITIVLFVPITLMIVGSLCSTGIYRLCTQSFIKLQQRMNTLPVDSVQNEN